MKPIRLLQILRKAEISLLSLGLMMTNIPPVNGEELSSTTESIVVAEENSAIEAETVLDSENPPELAEEETIITSAEDSEVITLPASADAFDDFSQAEDLPSVEGMTGEEGQEYVDEAVSAEGLELTLEENTIEELTREVSEEYSSVPEEYITVSEDFLPDLLESLSEEISSPAEENDVPETEIPEIVTSPEEENIASEEVSTEDLITPEEESEPDSSAGEESVDDEEETTLAEELSSEPETEVETEEGIEVDNAGAWTGKETVSILKATSTPTGTKLVWGAVSNADGYLIGAIQNGKKYRQIGFTTANSYVDKDASTTIYSYYWVFPFKKVDGKVRAGAISPYYVYGIKQLPKPANVKAQSQATSVKLTWDAVKDAVGYVIKARRGNGEVSVIADVETLTYTDNAAPYDEISYYWVYAYAKYGDKIRPGVVSSYVYGKSTKSSSSVSPTNDELYQARTTICYGIKDVVKSFSDAENYIPENRVQKSIDAVGAYIKKQYQEGYVKRYWVDEYGVSYVDAAKSEFWVWSPNVKDWQAGTGQVSISVLTYELLNDKTSSGMNKAGDNLVGSIEYYTRGYPPTTNLSSLAEIERIGSNQIVLWHGHGGYHVAYKVPYLWTGIPFNESLYSGYDFKWTETHMPEIIHTSLDDTGDGIDYLCVTPNYFYNHWGDSDMANTLVYIGSCHSLQSDALAAAFESHGATVVGFDETVVRSYNEKFCTKLFETLCTINPNTNKHYTLSDAITSVQKQSGMQRSDAKKDGQHIYAYPQYRGNPNYSLWHGTATGKITDKTNGDTPVQGAAVKLTNANTTITVTTDSNGNYKAMLPGSTYNVLVSKDGFTSVTGTISISSDETKTQNYKLEKALIVLEPSTLSIAVNATKAIKATITGSDKKPTWSSNNTSVATVDTNGKVTGRKNGTAIITAMIGSVSATCRVTVSDIPFEGGEGTKESPYLIKTFEQFRHIGEYSNAFFKQIADINAGGIVINSNVVWYKGDSFNGVYDGADYKLSNISLTGNSGVSVFGNIGSSGIVQNLKFNSITVHASSGENGIATHVNDGVISKCQFISCVLDDEYGDIICWTNNGMIQNVTVSSCKALSGQNSLGVSHNHGTMKNCTFTNSGGEYVQFGFAVKNYETIDSCKSTGLTLNHYSYGWYNRGNPLVHDNYGIIRNCSYSNCRLTNGELITGDGIAYNYGTVEK